jgi:sterol desaturase/sphingolipid hydroxylase (fatty acid hydroxylase superfamily)
MIVEYGPLFVLIYAIDCLLVQEVGLRVAFQAAVMFFYYYWLHRAMHAVPYFVANIHVSNHHQKEWDMPRSAELFLDGIFEMSGCIPPIIFQYITGWWIVEPILVVYTFLMITFSHIFNYSLYPSPFHTAHHTDPTKNFAPDCMDHLFGTNAQPEYEDGLQHVPAAIGAGIVVWLFFGKRD